MGNLLGAVADCWLLGGEASLVVPLRLARLARGGVAAKAEARLMVSEKIEAHGALLRDFSAGRLGKGASGITAGAVRHYLVLVRANRKRLMGGA
ncbi:MAG: hypothetical protein ABIM50_05680 [Novosphingobium sp.]